MNKRSIFYYSGWGSHSFHIYNRTTKRHLFARDVFPRGICWQLIVGSLTLFLSLFCLTAAQSAADTAKKSKAGSVLTTEKPLLSRQSSIPRFYAVENDVKLSDGSPFFTRYYLSHLSNHNVGFGNGWMSDFHLRLIPGENIETVPRMANGKNSQNYESYKILGQTGQVSGVFSTDGTYVQWHNVNGTKYTFKGSLPVRIDYPNSNFHTLKYTHERLYTVTDQAGRKLWFEHDAEGQMIISVNSNFGQQASYRYNRNNLSRVLVIDPNGSLNGNAQVSELPVKSNFVNDQLRLYRQYQYIDFINEHSAKELIPELTESSTRAFFQAKIQQQTVNTRSIDVSLYSGTSFPDSSFIEIRPENCDSFFDIQNPIWRGRAIEQAMSQSEQYENAIQTVDWFPAVDFIIGRTAVIQVSRDLSVASYNLPTQPRALYHRLMREGRSVSERFLSPLQSEGSVSATSRGETTVIRSSDIDDLRFELIVKRGSIQPHHLVQITQAQQTLMRESGIRMVVIEIP